MMAPRQLFLYPFLLSLLLAISACATKGPQGGLVSGSYGNPAVWLDAAAEHERKGDLQRALFDLRVARTVAKRDARIDTAIERLKAKIATQAEKRMKQGEQAMRKGKFAQARHYYLQVLSLDPKHEEALAAMRRIDKKYSKARMQKKVELSTQNYKKSAKTKKLAKGFHEEAYTYSRQAVLQPDENPVDIESYIKDIETHLEKFPQDTEVRELLANTCFKQAGVAFEAEKYGDALSYLERAEQASNGNRKKLQAIQKRRKAYGKALYNKGVRSVRAEPEQAARYWEYALRFDPENKKSQLRLHNNKNL